MLAAVHPEQPAIIFISQQGPRRTLSWQELDRRSNQLARLLQERDVDEHSLVTIGLPNCTEHFICSYAAWKLGALVLPVRYNLPARERDQILEVGSPAVVIADWDGVAFPLLTFNEIERSASYSDACLPDITAHPGKSVGSGGSTGRPKIIVDPRPWAMVPGDVSRRADVGMRAGQVQIVAGPLYHNSPFSWSHMGLFEDHTLVLLERFNAETVVDAIEQYQVNFGFLSPTMMQRIIALPDIWERDFSSVEGFFHTAAPCPPWLKRQWIELIGPEKLYEGFGATEAVGSCRIRGDEWLEHPGSVGRPVNCDMKILDEDDNQVAIGEVGEIFMKPWSEHLTYEYIGSPRAKSTPDGYTSVGDLGWVDEEGYLFLADRRTDLIITGGANVYPAEVEAALSEHPAIDDVAVIGVPDEEWGKRVHALVQIGQPVTAAELDGFVRDRITSYKIPKSYEFVDRLPRDDTGKIRRSSLVEERQTGWNDRMVRPKESIS